MSDARKTCIGCGVRAHVRETKVYPCLESTVRLCRKCAHTPYQVLPDYERANFAILLKVMGRN